MLSNQNYNAWNSVSIVHSYRALQVPFKSACNLQFESQSCVDVDVDAQIGKARSLPHTNVRSSTLTCAPLTINPGCTWPPRVEQNREQDESELNRRCHSGQLQSLLWGLASTGNEHSPPCN